MTPVERVARALCSYSGRPPDFWPAFTDQARAAISALEEPSDAMVLAMLQAWEQPLGDSIDTSDMTPNWKAAIRAALEEKP